MAPFQKFENLTIREILNKILTVEKANLLIGEIQEIVDSKATGEELSKAIYKVLCKYEVTHIEVFELLQITLQITPPPQQMLIAPNSKG